MKILIVEDDLDLSRSLTKLLKTQKYSTDAAYDGEEALDFLEVSDYDLVLLDVMMPKMDGFAFLREIRAQGKPIPVLMLTARDALEDRVTGLDTGADDYLVKPFEFEELLARIRALLRRRQPQVTTNRIQVADVELDLSQKQVYRGGEMVDLTSKEYQLFEYLVSHQGQVISREQIREHIWSFDYEGESNIIDVLIKNLRRKLDVGREGSIITTKRGLGYVILP